MNIPRRNILERIVQGEGIVDIEAASDERKFRVYKLTLREIEQIQRAQEIAKASLAEINKALNDVENGFLDLLNRPNKVINRDITTIMPKLIDAKVRLSVALTELKKGKTLEYFRALEECKFLIFEINQQL